MVKYIGAKDTAKVVRKILKEKFPGVKFSVRSGSYSMGSSVNVNWTDGPTWKSVQSAVGVLSGSGFDGMIDLKYYITHWLMPDGSFIIANSEGTEQNGGSHNSVHNTKPSEDAIEVNFADHISCTRKFSKSFLEEVIKYVHEKYGYDKTSLCGSDEFGYWLKDEPYEMSNVYFAIQGRSELINGKFTCYDHIYGNVSEDQI